MLEDRHCVPVISRQPLLQRLRRVVSPLVQCFPRLIIQHVGHRGRGGPVVGPRWLEFHVVRTAGRFVHPPTADALFQDVIGHCKFQNLVNLLPRLPQHLIQRLRLGQSPRKPVQNEPHFAVILSDTILDDPNHDLVAYETARLHHRLGLLPDLRPCGHRLPQHVTGGQLGITGAGHDNFGLGPLASAWRPEQHQHITSGPVERRKSSPHILRHLRQRLVPVHFRAHRWPIVVEDGHRVTVIPRQPLLQRLGRVVSSLVQRLTGLIIQHVRSRGRRGTIVGPRWLELDMVRTA
mmetsp:Transcript_51409/g.117231  ORF Transcript_51409/g.117231 Transcript_51409/m.117231 type:complete len:292 (+) Transcript_51409:1276-2151(+)